jgi:hypothetical protein
LMLLWCEFLQWLCFFLNLHFSTHTFLLEILYCVWISTSPDIEGQILVKESEVSWLWLNLLINILIDVGQKFSTRSLLLFLFERGPLCRSGWPWAG